MTLSRIRLFVPIIAAVVLTFTLQQFIISDPDRIREWLASWGGLSLVVYAVLQVATIVVAPLGGFALVIALLALFGPAQGLFYVYVVTIPAYTLNYFLARKYGAPFIKRISGDEGEKMVLRFTKHLDWKMLVLLKLLMNGYFDYIAYAAGLSDITPTQFLLINTLVGIPGFLLMAIALFFAPSFAAGIGLLYVIPIATGAVYLGLLHKRGWARKEEVAVNHEV